MVTRPIVKAWWWTGVPNFGDRLTPHLLDQIADLGSILSRSQSAEVICVGSILDAHIWVNLTVLGAGKLREDSRLFLGGNVSVRALRGPLSAKGIPGDCALGDPGLLAPDLVPPVAREHSLGIVHHWSDGSLAYDARFAKYKPIVIDPRGDPLSVIRAIGSCEKIVTSSLHGMIVADAFGIPRRFEYTPRFDREGGVFKFLDYSQSINTPFEIGKTIKANRFHVEKVQHELYDVFRDYGAAVKNAH